MIITLDTDHHQQQQSNAKWQCFFTKMQLYISAIVLVKLVNQVKSSESTTKLTVVPTT